MMTQKLTRYFITKKNKFKFTQFYNQLSAYGLKNSNVNDLRCRKTEIIELVGIAHS